jgi:hypothetical protein
MGTSPASRIVEISLEARILAKNDAMAARNRAWLAGLEILALNFVIATDEGLGASYRRLRDWAISAPVPSWPRRRMVSAISDRPQVQLSNKAVLVAAIDARFNVVGRGGVDWITLTPRRYDRLSQPRSVS